MSAAGFVDVELKGWKEIAEALQCSEDSAQRAAVRPFDPLPVYYDPWGNPETWRSGALAWRHRNTLPAFAYKALEEAGMLSSQRAADGSPGRVVRSSAVRSPKRPGIAAKKNAAVRRRAAGDSP
ncbi:hypothetical protein [Sorangium sp. So ce233]|uniref:hypothetical protein n=1 Tax=Sorangium sp. So ce233 TaxID=3133290 RepID=UPI003F634B6D